MSCSKTITLLLDLSGAPPACNIALRETGVIDLSMSFRKFFADDVSTMFSLVIVPGFAGIGRNIALPLDLALDKFATAFW